MNEFHDNSLEEYKKVFKPIFFICFFSFTIGSIAVRNTPVLQSHLISFLIIYGPLFVYLSMIDLTKIVFFNGYERSPKFLYKIGSMILVGMLPAFLATLAGMPVMIFLEEFGFVK